MTASDTTTLGTHREEQARLRGQLARLRRRLRLEMALEFTLEAAAIMVAAAVVLVVLDWWIRMGLAPRLLMLTLALGSILCLLGVRAVRRWRAAQLDDLSLAMTLDRFRPGTGGRIADVLELPGQLGEPRETVSAAMIRLAVRQASEALEASDWSKLWNRRRTARAAAALGAALLVPVLFAIAAPGAARLSLERWLLGSIERWPQRTYLSIVGLGDRRGLLVPRDEPFLLEVAANPEPVRDRAGRLVIPGRGEPLTLKKRPSGLVVPRAVRLRERTEKGAVRDAVLTSAGPALFRYELPPSSSASTFDLTGGDDWLGPIRVERVDRPALAATRLRVREPGSPGNDFGPVVENPQHPVYLPDTEIELTLVGSEPVSEARLTVHPGEPPQLERTDAKSFTCRWVLREATTLEIQLTSRATGLTSKPAFFSIGLLKDRVPRVVLRALGVGAHVTPVATIPLSVSATDDRGLAAVRLQLDRTVQVDDKSEPKTTRKTVAIPLPQAVEAAKSVLDHQARHDVELQAEPPAVGTFLRFVAEADDRCARGTQVGRSAAVQMQVVPPDELFYEILIRQRAERTKFLALVDEAEKRTPLLEGKPAPEDYAKALRGLHAGVRQLELIGGRIADTLQEMKLNQIGSPKSHRLLQEGVIDPIRELNSGPIGALRTMLQTLATTGPRAGADAESARKLHAEVVARMKTILEQMSQWESFVDVVNQVAEVIKMQHNVLQATEKARESRTQEVFDEKP